MPGPYGEDAERDEQLTELLEFLGTSEVPTSALKSRREATGLTQHELARASGVSQPVISRIEAGTTPLTAEAAERLDAAFGTDARFGELPLEQLELLAGLKRQALEGEVSPTKMKRTALVLASAEPSAERVRPTINAAVSAMLDVAETARSSWRGERTKSRDGLGRRREKPTGERSS